MKEIIIIVCILVIIIGGGIYIQKYLEKSSQELVIQLEELKEIVENNDDIEKIKNKSNNIYDIWQKTDEKWSIIVLHSELDLIETTLIEMKSDIELENIEKSKPELEKSIFLINHINEKEKFNLKNVF